MELFLKTNNLFSKKDNTQQIQWQSIEIFIN